MKSTKTIILAIFSVVVIVVIGYLWNQNRLLQMKFDELAESPSVQEEKIVKETIDKLGQHVVLPKNETPSIATVQDAEAIKQDSTFYADAKNGDQVIIYQTKAYLYDPSADRVVNIGPVILPTQEATQADAVDNNTPANQ